MNRPVRIPERKFYLSPAWAACQGYTRHREENVLEKEQVLQVKSSKILDWHTGRNEFKRKGMPGVGASMGTSRTSWFSLRLLIYKSDVQCMCGGRHTLGSWFEPSFCPVMLP